MKKTKQTTAATVAVGTLQPKSTFTHGGVSWVVLPRIGNGVLCLAEKILFKQAFDADNYNNWEDSSLREHLNNDFLEELIENGAASDDFLAMVTDLTADDGLKDYGSCEDIISLISCQQYRQYRGIIPNAYGYWWTCTAYSTKANGYSYYARLVNSDGTLGNDIAYNGHYGVRPLCTLSSSILVSPTHIEENNYTQIDGEVVENSENTEEYTEEQPVMAENQEDADEEMSNKCECGSASVEQKKAKLMERINYICKGKYNPALNELTPDQTEMIRQGGLNVMRCNAENITFDTRDSKIKIWMAKEKIKVSRMASQEEVAEI